MKAKTALCAAEVKNAINLHRVLEDKAQEILDAGSCGCDEVAGLNLSKDGSIVEVVYWTSCRGERYVEEEYVPIEWFGKGDWKDLEKLWEEKRTADRIKAAKAAKREERRMKAEKKRQELAELKRLKAKYPGV